MLSKHCFKINALKPISKHLSFTPNELDLVPHYQIKSHVSEYKRYTAFSFPSSVNNEGFFLCIIICRYHFYRNYIKYNTDYKGGSAMLSCNKNITQTNCSDLLNDAINTLNEALVECNCSPPPCSCSASITTWLTDSTVQFLGEKTGNVFLFASVCEGCDTFVFRFKDPSTQLTLTFCDATITQTCCTNSFIAISGTGTLVIDTIPAFNLNFSLGFGNSTLTQCTYNLAISEPGKPVFLQASDIVDCSNITITPQ